jgi:CubicO group peptidase (beta-lactamase class C family)
MAGYSDAAKTHTVSENDLYFVYSATKVVTCTAAMQLVEKGLISLSDPVGKYLPAFGSMNIDTAFDWNDMAKSLQNKNPKTKPAINNILVYHLMTMTAGLTYNYLSDEVQKIIRETDKKASTVQIAEAIAKMPLIYEPGSRWMYSLAHDVLAAVIETVSGMKFSDYLTRYIWEPLGITNMYFKADEDILSRLSQQYKAGSEGGGIIPVSPANHLVLSANHESGGAGLICTAGDYALFADALCNRGVGKTGYRILGSEMIDKMRSNWLGKAQSKDFAMFNRKGYSYGLGVRTLIDNTFSKSPIGEFGWDGAGGVYVLIDVGNSLCVFYAQHVLDYGRVYYEVHPTLRDLTYEEIMACI